MAALNWNLMFLLPLHFIEEFLSNGVLYSNEPDVTAETIDQITEKVHLLSKKIPLLSALRQFTPSKVAATCIFRARKEAHLKTLWPVELIRLTNTLPNEI